MIKRYLASFIIFFCTATAYATDGDPDHTFFIQPEFMIGKNVRIYDKFPESSLRKTLALDFGYIYQDTTLQWVSYYNYPSLGISLAYSDLGNPAVLGKEYSVIPYALLKTSRNPRKSFDFKVGLGLAYCTNPYNAENNPANRVIGAPFNWGLQLFLFKNLFVSSHLIIKTGVGFMHTSDAHTRLPNYGLNSAMLSLALEFPQGNYDPDFAAKQKKLKIERSHNFFLQVRYGQGWHELGGTTYPLGGPSFGINNYLIAGGVLINRQLKLSIGFIYRYYQSFYHYILNTPDIEWGTDPPWFRQDPHRKSSDVIFNVGCEFLIGHVGFEVNEGIQLYKPFYREFNYRFEFKHGFNYFRNRYISSRVGINYYLINTSKMPANNFWIGAHIDANFGKADFMEVCAGYSLLFK